jgi:hypothetical protein
LMNVLTQSRQHIISALGLISDPDTRLITGARQPSA